MGSDDGNGLDLPTHHSVDVEMAKNVASHEFDHGSASKLKRHQASRNRLIAKQFTSELRRASFSKMALESLSSVSPNVFGGPRGRSIGSLSGKAIMSKETTPIKKLS